jgi:L-lactate utilization protein LutB
MIRPTKDAVDDALEVAEYDAAHPSHRAAARLLAAEVRALRAEHEEWEESARRVGEVRALRAEVARLEAIVERVKALCEERNGQLFGVREVRAALQEEP